MIRLLRSLAAVLVAVLFGFVSPAAAVQPPGAPATGHTYTFVSSLYELPPRCPSPERGPPTDGIELTVAAFQHAVGRGSDGASARSCGYAATPAYDYAATDELSYTDTSQHGQVGAREQSGAVSLHRSQVAAKAGSKLLPKVNNAFQFPGAGRSGAGVKNLVGPPNTIARGASPGRVFVTDEQGRVISDVTRDRVKPVVPGQGFVSGDGRKLTPTSEQLSWIDELWGG